MQNMDFYSVWCIIALLRFFVMEGIHGKKKIIIIDNIRLSTTNSMDPRQVY